MSSAPRGLAPREGLGSVLMKMGRAGPPFEPRRRPQAGKSGDPHSQNTDSSPRAQGALGLGLAEKRRGKCEAPRAPIACGLGRRVAVDWTWASWLPTAPRQLHKLIREWCLSRLTFFAFSFTAQIPFLAPILLAAEIPRSTPTLHPSKAWRLARPQPEHGTRLPWILRMCQRRILLGRAR